MSKHITRWSPDTCGCVLDYEWDDSVPQDQRTHAISEVVKACPNHQDTAEKVYEKVKDENTTKNRVLGEIMESVPALVEEVIDDNGNISKRFKRGMEPKWSFDENRQLQIELVSSEKAQMKTILDNKFGVNKVKLL